MSEAAREGSLPVLIAYWFLAALAWVFVVMALWHVNRIRTERPLLVHVLERMVKVEVREVSGKRGPYPALFAEAALRLERLDTHAVVTMKMETRPSKEELVTMEFLDRWEPGKTMAAAEAKGAIELDPPNPWLAVAGFSIAAYMFGVFAWIANSSSRGVGTGLRILALGLLPAGVAAFGIGSNMLKARAEQALERVPVEGWRKEILVTELRRQLGELRVTAGEDVQKHFGDADRTEQYCEYVWAGKTWRTTSTSCQPCVDEACRGRLNPGNPRDVKWGAEQ